MSTPHDESIRAPRPGNGGGDIPNGPGPRPLKPVITSIDPPGGGTPGGSVTIQGRNFGEADGGTVYLRPAWQTTAVSVTPSSWSAGAIDFTVPQDFGGPGGLVQVTVDTGEAASDAHPWSTSPPHAPTISVNTNAAEPGQTVIVTGQNLGQSTTVSGRAIVPPGFAVTGGTPTYWVPGQITLLVADDPSTTSITVTTPVATASAGFSVAYPPRIDNVQPPHAVPDAVVTINGAHFGTGSTGAPPAQCSVKVGTPGSDVDAEVVSWSDRAIAIRVPGVARLEPTVATRVLVTTPWQPPATHAFTVDDRPSITTWTRLEPHARTDDLQEGLRLGLQARTYDAAWLLARQWQLGEFAATDGGTPIGVGIQGEIASLSRWRPGAAGAPADLPALPLEALVTREAGTGPPGWSARRAVETGLQFLRMLDAAAIDPTRRQAYRSGFLAPAYAMTPAPATATRVDDATRAYLAVVAGRVPDGRKLAQALAQALPKSRGGSSKLPAHPPVDPRDQPAMLALVAAWFAWCGDYVVEAAPGRAAWVDERLEYQFAVGAQTGAGERVLTAPAYDGEPLDWYDFDVDGGTTLGAPTKPARPAPLQANVIPAPVVYPGMPAPRFWQFEDARVDFGAVDAAPADLAHLLLIEFATVFGNDWFVAPVADVHVGSLVTLQSVTLQTTFGDALTLQPLADGAVASGAWRMFELSPGAGAPPSTGRLLLVPPSLASRLDGVEVEEVDFVRDAQAALVWAIERSVESTIERPLDRQQQFEARLERERLAAGAPPPALAPVAYRLETDVDDYWIPFQPAIRNGQRLLARAAMVRPVTGGGTEQVVPLGRVAGPASSPRDVFDEEVPREGTKVVRTYRYARWTDGSTYLWAARRRRTAGTASSGLQFDSVEPAG